MELQLDFIGERYSGRDTITFGRDGDIELDANPFLHRVTGAFVREGDRWWVNNLGSKLHLSVIANDGTRVELPPSSRHMLIAGCGIVRVVAGQATYEIGYEALDTDLHADKSVAAAACPTAGTRTEHFAATLTPREIDFLVTFARPHLLGLRDPLPTYAEVAALWSVSPKTLDNTLQSVKRKFRDAGLIRDQTLDVLIHSAVQHSLITRADLDLARLDSGEPRSASSSRRVAD